MADRLYVQHSFGAFTTEQTQSRLHAQLWGVRKEIHQHMNIQFRRSFYLQTLLLCTSVADNVLDQSFKKHMSTNLCQTSGKISPTTKSCNGSALFPLKIITNITLSITDLNKWTFEQLQLQTVNKSHTGPLIWIQSQTKGMIR